MGNHMDKVMDGLYVGGFYGYGKKPSDLYYTVRTIANVQ